MVQCEFNKAELLDLEIAVMQTLIECKIAQRDGTGAEGLDETTKRIEKLYNKLGSLIEIA